MARYLTPVVTFLFAMSFGVGGCQEIRSTFDTDKIVRITDDLDFRCVPASILNSMQFGSSKLRLAFSQIPGAKSSDKLSRVVEKYGKLESTYYPRKIYDEQTGVKTGDVLRFYNSLLFDSGYDDQMTERFANRWQNEPPSEHLARIHGYICQSLASEVPIVAGLRSNVPVQMKDGNFRWEAKHAHAITIVKVPVQLKEFQNGFAFDFIDSSGGTISEGYMYVELVRDFSAPIGVEGKTLFDRPFLVVTAPEINMKVGDLPVQVRSMNLLYHLVGSMSFESSPPGKN